MKKLTLCFFFYSLLPGLQAQPDAADVRTATDEAVALYQLDEKQAEQMYAIQELRFQNLQSIEPLKETDHQLYWQKMNSVREGMLASVKRILKSEQMEIFNRQLTERRKKESALVKELKQEGATREEIRMAVWKLE